MAYPGRRRQKKEILSMLLEKADVQGYLTTDDLMEFYPEGDEDSEHLSAVVLALRRRGVDILDHDTEDEFIEDELPQTDLDPNDDIERIGTDDTVGLYLKEMSRVPLLSIDEELDLSQRIERGRMAKDELAELGVQETIRRHEELDTVIQDGVLAREHLIKAKTQPDPDSGKPASGCQYCEKIYRTWCSFPRFDPGGESGFDEGGREI